MTSSESNPYAAPLIVEEELPIRDVNGDPLRPLNVRHLESKTLMRRVKLFGQINAIIEWNANDAREFVSVDGKRVIRKLAVNYIPTFEFRLRADGVLYHVRIDVCIKWVFFTRAFRVQLDGDTVYSEGDCERYLVRD